MTTLTRETTTVPEPAPEPVSSPLTAASARFHYYAHHASRALTWVLVAIIVLTVANWVSELILPPSANAVAGIPDLTAICDPNYQLPEPGNPTISMDGEYTRAGDQELWVTPNTGSYIGGGAMGAAYGTGGLTWHTYGTSMCQPLDWTVNVTTLLAGFLLSALVASSSLMGFSVQAAFSTNIVNSILGGTDMTDTVTSMNTNLWDGWYPLILGASIVFIGLLVARTQVQAAMSRLLWTVVATALMAGLAISPGGMATLGTYLNDATRAMSSSAMLAVSGPSEACSTLSEGETPTMDDSVTCMATTMSNDFVMPTWSVGAAGVRANESAPVVTDDQGTTGGASPDGWVHWNTEGDGVGDDVKYAATQLPPKGVVPASRADGTPTTAEYLRWTQTYTAAEAAALEDNEGMRCSQTGSPSLEDLGKMATKDDDMSNGNLCVKKWAVRAAILYGLKTSDPSAYAAATGKDDLNSRISPAVMSAPISSLAQGSMGLVSILMFFYQLEFLIYLLLVGLFLIASIVKGPHVMGSWAGWVAASMLKRVGLGLVLGLALMIFRWIQNGLISVSLDGWGALMLVFSSLITQTIFLCGMVAVLVMWFKLRKVLLQQTKLDRFGTSKPVESLKGVGNRVLGAGAGAISGGVTGGAAGAAIGAGTAALNPKANLLSSVRKGVNSGQAMTQARLTSTEAKETVKISGAEALRQKDQAREHALESNAQETIATRARGDSQALSSQSQDATRQATRYEESVDAEVTEYVTTQTPEGRQVADTLATSHIEVATAQDAVQEAQVQRSEFAHKHDLSHMHELDNNGNLVITNLATGESRNADISEYRPELAPNQVFTNESMVNDYNNIKVNEIAAQDELDQAEIKRDASQMDLNAVVRDNRKDIAGMSDKQIEQKFAHDPELADQAKQWKINQFRAQKLHEQAAQLNKQSMERRKVADKASKAAAKERGESEQATYRATKQERQSTKAEQVLQTKSAGKTAANQLLHGLGGSSRRRR